MQNGSSTVVVTACVPRELNETVTELARSNHHSKAAEIRQALASWIATHSTTPAEESLRHG